MIEALGPAASTITSLRVENNDKSPPWQLPNLDLSNLEELAFHLLLDQGHSAIDLLDMVQPARNFALQLHADTFGDILSVLRHPIFTAVVTASLQICQY